VVNPQSPAIHSSPAGGTPGSGLLPSCDNESVAYATHPIPDLLESLHIEAVNSGACYGDWIPNP